MTNLISIIIVNWNGQKWLKACFDSLLRQTYENWEIIFVDNGSTDDSVNFVRQNYPQVKIIVNQENFGFAKGNNIGLAAAVGKYVLLLNTDTEVEPDFLAKLIKAFDEIPELAVVQPKIKLLKQPERLDVCGAFWTSYGLLYHYGSYKDQSLDKYNKPLPIFSGKGAALMIKKAIIDQVGLFDDEFWCYYEETDFCHRVWLAGWQCWYYPSAVCYHAVGGSSLLLPNSRIQFHSAKNKLSSFLKNFEIMTLLKFLPVYFLFNIFISLAWLAQGRFKHFLALYRAIGWNIGHWPVILRKRKIIQSARKKTDQEIFKLVKKNPSLTFYYYAFIGSDKYEDK